MCIVDENDIVYHTGGSSLARQGGTLQDEPEQAPREPALKLTADEALLFRFSALTYNAHRIHYDHNWVREEGYRCLVVHGPLQALMMGELIPAGETSFVAVGQRGEPAYTVVSLARAGTRPLPTRSNPNRRRHGCDGIPAGS